MTDTPQKPKRYRTDEDVNLTIGLALGAVIFYFLGTGMRGLSGLRTLGLISIAFAFLLGVGAFVGVLFCLCTRREPGQ